MNLQKHPSPDRLLRRLPALRWARGRVGVLTASLAVLVALAFGSNLLRAGDGGGPGVPGGGDAIGSLPFNMGAPEALSTPTRPSLVLEGPSLAAIEAVVLDAWGDGYAELTETEVGVRVELQGAVHLLLDRHRLAVFPVTFGLDVSQGFSGGLGVLVRDQQLISTQVLPALGDLGLPLASLAESGVLDEGGLTLHSYSVVRKHHGLELLGSGGTLRLSSHE